MYFGVKDLHIFRMSIGPLPSGRLFFWIFGACFANIVNGLDNSGPFIRLLSILFQIVLNSPQF